MFLGFTVNGKVVLYQVPDFHTVLATHLGNQPPQHGREVQAKAGGAGGDYSELIVDASIVASIQEVAKNASDAGISNALQGGIEAAIQALQKRAGKSVTIKE